MKPDAAKQLKELELENTRMKKPVADQALDVASFMNLWRS
jgi:hypothetical protein